MNGKSAARAADFSFYKRNESSLSDSFYKKKNYQTESLVGFSILKTEPTGKGAANPYFKSFPFSKRSQQGKAQPIPILKVFHSQNGANRERRRQSLS
ncbi:hypothetical protein FK178_15115 [Antarcticibacterium arcticum]|uniref:Uncharacterized protein n=1 Tax=Antarcticibacterium arcticum TaxID=2585771 RepID=A0A5B8YMJ5_9FLAO|nr:hypothetical protein [Antarcticibacterium arcticum]QED38964.1 hypothetical protein FK178_15115 [Antarcticibacterium arcticum]